MNFNKINFKSPLIILIILLIIILIALSLLNQNKINFTLTNDDSKFNFTLNTENFKGENILNESTLNSLEKKIIELENTMSTLKDSSHQFDIPILKRNYIKNQNYYN